VHVFVVTNDFPPRAGGINYYVDQLMRRLPAEWQVTIFSSTYPGAAEFDRGYPHEVIRLPTEMRLPTPGVRRELHALLRARRPDLVLFGAIWPLGHMGPGIRQKLGIPYGGFSHGLELTAALVPGLLGPIGRQASLLTAASAWSRGKVEAAFDWRGRMTVLTSGIDVDTFRPTLDDTPVRERHSLGGAPVVCCISRLVPRKGQDMLIRAMPQITRAVPDARLLIVGHGPYDGALRALAQRTGVADRVVFAGVVSYDELPLYFRAGDVFAMPCRSRWFGLDIEALGAVFLQGSAVGRPIIVGDSGGAPETVKHGETGLVVDPTSVPAIAEACIRLLRDRSLAAAMGNAGAAWIHADYTWDAMARRLTRLIEEATVSSRPARPWA
jgi:phosphatidylinositol alpha-1,6-mannosyltransferase